MEELRQMNIKNHSYYFYNNIIDFDEFDESKIKIDKKDFNDINIYYLGYEYKKKITECNVINSVNPIYLRIRDITGQFKKNKDGNAWYLIISDDADILRKFANIWKIIRATKYYLQNKDAIKEKAKEHYRNLPQEKKDQIREYQKKKYQELVQ